MGHNMKNEQPIARYNLKPLVCGCRPHPVRVYVSITDFQAKCLKCGKIFREKKYYPLDNAQYWFFRKRFLQVL